MYNAQQKKTFVSYQSSKQDVGREEVHLMYKSFDWLQPFEESWNCDLSSQNDEEKLQEMTENLMRRRVQSEDFLIIFRNYIRWCKSVDAKKTSTALLNIVPDKIMDIKMISLSGPDHLQKYLSAIYRPEIEHTIDNVYRTFYWLAYSGIEEPDAYEIEADHVNLKKSRIEYKGLIFPIYKEAIPAIKSCAEDETFAYYNDIYRKGPTERQRAAGKKLLRGIRGNFTLENKILRVQVSKNLKVAFDNKQIAMRVSYFNVWRSGIFYREWIREKKDSSSPQSFENVAEAQLKMGSKARKTSKSATEKERCDRIVRELNKTYKQWKIAHGYA